MEKGETKTKMTRSPVEPWVVSGFFDFKYDMAPNTSKPKMLIEKFQLSLMAAINVLYDEDPAACVLHREEPYLTQLREMADFDRKYSTWSKWLRLDNNNSFNRGTDKKPRSVRGTIRLGSKIDI